MKLQTAILLVIGFVSGFTLSAMGIKLLDIRFWLAMLAVAFVCCRIIVYKGRGK